MLVASLFISSFNRSATPLTSAVSKYSKRGNDQNHSEADLQDVGRDDPDERRSKHRPDDRANGHGSHRAPERRTVIGGALGKAGNAHGDGRQADDLARGTRHFDVGPVGKDERRDNDLAAGNSQQARD